MIQKKKVLLTIIHDFLILFLSFILALWLRLEGDSYELIKLLSFYNLFFAILTILFLYRFGLYQGIWRYASIQEISSIFKSLVASCLIILATLFLTIRLESIPRSFPVLLFIVSLLGISGPRIFYRLLKDKIEQFSSKEKKIKIPVLIVGENNTSELFIRSTNRENKSPFKVIGIIGLKKNSIGRSIHGIPILSNINNLYSLKQIFKSKKITKPQRIIITEHNLKKEIIESLFIFAKKSGLAIGEIPKITDFKINNIDKFNTKPIVIEDVLGREQKVHDTSILKNLKNKKIIITGAGGSIGTELSIQISKENPERLILIEQNEFALYKISQKLRNSKIEPAIADVRDFKKLDSLISKVKPDIIFHAAALKHITFVENDPMEALKTNFLGTVNISNLCEKYMVPNLIFISTDKAVNPSNIMGASKRLCEKYLQMIGEKNKVNFQIVRFGNVLGSTGSVIPLFQRQIKFGIPITITHPKVTRYFMTIREAVELVLICSLNNEKERGFINILEMGDPIKIKDLAQKMIRLSGKKDEEVKIVYTNLRKGEKLNEELFYKQEKIERTNIDGILKTATQLYPVKEKDILDLIKNISDNNIEISMNLFRKNLPEFK